MNRRSRHGGDSILRAAVRFLRGRFLHESKEQTALKSTSFSLTPQEKERYLRQSQSARLSETYQARVASTRYLRWLSVPHSPEELAKYLVPTTVAELRKIQEAFSTA